MPTPCYTKQWAMMLTQRDLGPLAKLGSDGSRLGNKILPSPINGIVLHQDKLMNVLLTICSLIFGWPTFCRIAAAWVKYYSNRLNSISNTIPLVQWMLTLVHKYTFKYCVFILIACLYRAMPKAWEWCYVSIRFHSQANLPWKSISSRYPDVDCPGNIWDLLSVCWWAQSGQWCPPERKKHNTKRDSLLQTLWARHILNLVLD